jgi:hypothetical protein
VGLTEFAIANGYEAGYEAGSASRQPEIDTLRELCERAKSPIEAYGSEGSTQAPFTVKQANKWLSDYEKVAK